MRSSLAALFAGALLAAGPAQAAVPREPTGKWIVDYADKMCVLQRDYGTADKPLMLSLRPSNPGEYISLYVFDARTGQPGDDVFVRISFGKGQKYVDALMETFDPEGGGLRFNRTGLRRLDLQQAEKSGTIALRTVGRIDAAFKVPLLKEALNVLDDCVADLLDQWGYKREVQKTVVQRATALESVFHFPRHAFKKDLHGVNSARVWVEVSGRASDCVVVESSGERSFDDAICKGLLGGRYSPAKDRGGQPVRSIYFTRVTWANLH